MPENTQQQQPHFDRRATDQLPHVSLLLDIKAEVQAIRTELVEFKRDVTKAFPKDEEGLPDYSGHRKFHAQEAREDAKKEEYKTDFAKKLYAWAGIGAIGFVLSAVIQYIRGGQ